MNPSPSPNSCRPRLRSLAAALGLVALLCLPNLLLAFVSPKAGLAAFLCMQGLALMLLPSGFGLPLKKTLAFWLPFVALVPACCAFILTTRYQPTEWAVIALIETGMEELGSFVLPVAATLLITPVLLWACWSALRRNGVEELRLPRSGQALVLATALAQPVLEFSTIGLGHGWKPSVERLAKTFPFSMAVSVVQAVRVRSSIANRTHVTHDFAAAAEEKLPAGGRDIHLLAIGETCRSASFALHGYERPTTPRLQAEADLLDFRDVAAGASYTSLSVPMILTSAEPGSHRDAPRSPSLINVFRKAGYKVYWVSTQKKHGLGDTSCSLYAKDADESIFLSGIVDATGTGSYATPHDDAVLPEVRRLLARGDPKVLIICHLMGSHSTYTDRYPKLFERWPVNSAIPIAKQKLSLTGDEKANLHNAYDNSILFTDHVLAELIGILKEQQGISTSFCFIPDHGENGGDSVVMPFAHGSNTLDVLKVPMFMWLSPAFQEARAEKAALLRSRTGTPFSSYDIFHTLPDLAGISAPVLKPEHSLCHARYAPGIRKVVSLDGEGWMDYDKAVAEPAARRGGWRPLSPKGQTAQNQAASPTAGRD